MRLQGLLREERVVDLRALDPAEAEERQRLRRDAEDVLEEDDAGRLVRHAGVDLREGRWAFLNTLFSVSEGCLYAQLVDRLDSGELSSKNKPPFDEERCGTYEQLHLSLIHI